MVLIFSKGSARGFIKVNNRMYTYEVFPAKDESNFSGLIKLEWRLKIVLGDSFTKFLSENNFHNIRNFHDKFSEFVQGKLSKTEENPKWLQASLKSCAFIKIFQEELETFAHCLKDFDLENGTVTVEITDSQLRIHSAQLKLSQHYQVEPINVISHDLPLPKNSTESSFSHILSVSEFFQKFSELVTHFQEFWNKMNMLDSQCYVLDPASPTFKDVYRRIKLTDILSVVLTFNPFFPNEKPHMKLLGSYLDVNHYQNILQNNLEKDIWDPDEDLLYNLTNLLEITIPGKDESEIKDLGELADKGECAICFCWRVKDEIPSEVCENSMCRAMYHSTCLFKYLSSLPRNRDYFSKIQGECPNCDGAITCTVPNFF